MRLESEHRERVDLRCSIVEARRSTKNVRSADKSAVRKANENDRLLGQFAPLCFLGVVACGMQIGRFAVFGGVEQVRQSPSMSWKQLFAATHPDWKAPCAVDGAVRENASPANLIRPVRRVKTF